MKQRMMAVFVLVSVVLSGCLSAEGPEGKKVVAYFQDAGDLVPGGTVQVKDIEVGSIESIGLVLQDGDMVAEVTMSVDPSAEVPGGELEAFVRQTSLLGEQFVELAGGDPATELAGETSIPVERTARRVDVETFLADLSGFIGEGGLEDLNRFTHAQALILEDRGRRFGEVIGELEKFTGVLSDRRYDIGAAIDSLASASSTLNSNRDTLDSFLDSLESANSLLADQGDELQRLFSSLRNFGTVSARFLAKNESAIGRQFKALRPVLDALADNQGALRSDLVQLRTFLKLFPKSFGGGPGDRGEGDYVQIQAVLCEALVNCNTKGEPGDVPGEGF